MIRVRHRLLIWTAVCLMAMPRLAHINLLWSDEDYHLAAALQILHGRVPYRDFWYDKPPLAGLFYALIDGYGGWLLRWLDTGYVIACCFVAYKLARAWWGEAEGYTAALLMAFFTAFYLPAATIPFAVDGLLLLPHLAAIYFAYKKEAFWSGFCCAIGLLTNVKAVFVAATCAVWLMAEIPMFLGGLAIPLAAAAIAGGWLGALSGCYQQVWVWGMTYAKGATIADPAATDLKRCLAWLGFHAALAAGIVFNRLILNKGDWFRLGVWLALSVLALLMGNHFAPRYFFQVLPVMVIGGASGIVFAVRRYKLSAIAVLAILLIIPVVRFGPRYGELALDNVEGKQTHWQDAALDLDSQRVADIINASKHGGDSLFVWGYRPDIYVYTRLMTPGRFWDSQPLDGVPADRHLQSTESAAGDLKLAANRMEVAKTRPIYVVDGLGELNPKLGLERFPELREWLRNYRMMGKTKLSRVYELAR